MARALPRTLHVISKQTVTPNMLRVTLGGDGMLDFPEDQAGGYIKLMFTTEAESKPLMRTYTIRKQREDQMDVDFVLHSDRGPASNWATHCKVGDSIVVGGPGLKKPLDHSADYFLLVGDMTALPAISVNIEALPADAQGAAILEVIDQADIQPLNAPAGMELIWIINHQPGQRPEALASRVRQLHWPDGRVNVWAACEFTGMRALRQYFRDERQVDRGDLYISSYWKQGSNEDQHKQLKREDAVQAEGTQVMAG
ncbi:siderophore-interacting protein [Halopseudomonas pelagia]|uniref:siderophore-interacting protein n=1 Tax=Halopseudomonas pelagia TaxID=553151 RepID=UPI0030DB3987